MYKIPWKHHVFTEGTIDRRGREEFDIWAQVVATKTAFVAPTARHSRFHRHRGSHRDVFDTLAKTGHHARGFVTEDQGTLDYKVSDPSVLEVVDIAAAYADGLDLDEHLPWTRLGDGTLSQGQAQVWIKNTHSLHECSIHSKVAFAPSL
jgi:hypothetical protein